MATRTAVLTKFIAGALFDDDLATVPSNSIWVVKDVLLFGQSGSSTGFGLWLTDQTGAQLGMIVDQAIANGAVVHWQGYAAMGPGDRLHASNASGTVKGWVSGAKLPGT